MAGGGGGFDDRAIVHEVLNGITESVDAPGGSLLALCIQEPCSTRPWLANGSWPASRLAVGGGARRAPVLADEGRPLLGQLRTTPDGTHDNCVGHFVKSFNDAMDRSGWPDAKLLRVQQIAEAAAVLKTAGLPVKCAARRDQSQL